MNNFIKNIYNSLFPSKSSVEKLGIEEFKISLLEKSIEDIISSIDNNEEEYNSLISTTERDIEKGFSGGEFIKGRLIERYKLRERELLKSLFECKKELRLLKGESIESPIVREKIPNQYSDCIIRDSHGNILMLLRTNGDGFEPNKWGLPGGGIESGETSIISAKRELKEETGLDCISCYKIGEKKLENGGTIYYHECYIENDTNWISLDSEEHSNYCFMSIDEIRRRDKGDFILDLKDTLLKLLDPEANIHINTIIKGFSSGKVEEETFRKVMRAYSEFKYKREDERE